jgi:sarcosine oxidase subunit gamma
MPEARASRMALNNPAVLQINVDETGTTLLLKSWLNEDTDNDKRMVVAGLELPSHVGSTISGPVRVLCLAPGEWLLVSPAHSGSNLKGELEPDLPTHGLTLVDLTDGFSRLLIQGPLARELLSKGCGLDIHPRHFMAGRCARTRFSEISVVVECTGACEFELHVARSYLRYLSSWLVDAAAEFQTDLT